MTSNDVAFDSFKQLRTFLRDNSFIHGLSWFIDNCSLGKSVLILYSLIKSFSQIDDNKKRKKMMMRATVGPIWKLGCDFTYKQTTQ